MAENTICAATIIEQRPSGRHYERWTVRLTYGAWCGEDGYTLYSGGGDGFWYGKDEPAALSAFDSAARPI